VQYPVSATAFRMKAISNAINTRFPSIDQDGSEMCPIEDSVAKGVDFLLIRLLGQPRKGLFPIVVSSSQEKDIVDLTL